MTSLFAGRKKACEKGRLLFCGASLPPFCCFPLNFSVPRPCLPATRPRPRACAGRALHADLQRLRDVHVSVAGFRGLCAEPARRAPRATQAIRPYCLVNASTIRLVSRNG